MRPTRPAVGCTSARDNKEKTHQQTCFRRTKARKNKGRRKKNRLSARHHSLVLRTCGRVLGAAWLLTRGPGSVCENERRHGLDPPLFCCQSFSTFIHSFIFFLLLLPSPVTSYSYPPHSSHVRTHPQMQPPIYLHPKHTTKTALSSDTCAQTNKKKTTQEPQKGQEGRTQPCN